MARTTNKKGALTVMIVILVILGLSAAGIGYYLYTIQDVTPQESNASTLETSGLCLDILAFQEAASFTSYESEVTSTALKSYLLKEESQDLSLDDKISFISIFSPLPTSDSSIEYTNTTYTINGIEHTVPTVSYDSLDQELRTTILEFYEQKGITLAELSQRKFAIHSEYETNLKDIKYTLNIAVEGEISSIGETQIASCGALFTIYNKYSDDRSIDDNGCISNGFLPEVWCEGIQQCVQIEDVGLCPDPPPAPIACPEDAKICDDGSSVSRDPTNNCEFETCDHGCILNGILPEVWCTGIQQCVQLENVNLCPDPPAEPPITSCNSSEYWCESTSQCISQDELCLNPPISPPACQEDTQTCADGSTVSRNPTNNCDFNLCPLAGGAVCGNSIIEDGETCDDGNTTADDGCSTTCQLEADTSTTSNITVTIAGSTTCVERVSPSDTVSFTISITNNDTDTEDISKIVNKLPLGFTYTAGSTLINGSTISDSILTITETGSTQELTWDPAPGEDWTLLAGQTMTLRLTAIAGDSALTGGNQNEAVVTPVNTPLDPSTLRATHVVTVAQTCTSPVTGLFDTMIGRIAASMILIITAIVFYKSNSSQQLSEKYINNKAVNNINTGFRLFGLKLTHPRKFFEEQFEDKQKKQNK